MNYLKISLGVFIALGVSRFVPHPPNFTSLLALSFYVPVLLGTRYIPALIIAFIITDFFIGFHNVQIFTWGSIVLIGLLSKKFTKNTLSRISWVIIWCMPMFFLITNFGVWSLGSYEYSAKWIYIMFYFSYSFFCLQFNFNFHIILNID